MSEIKAIETVYNGYRFRSRLEARWAVFFDALGIRYEYEVESFDLGEVGYYLPDFWLPDYGWWEVKGNTPTRLEREKIIRLAEGTNHPAFLAWGEVRESTPLDDDTHEVELILPLNWNSYITNPDSTGLTYGLFSSWINWEECPICYKLLPVGVVLLIAQGIIVGYCGCQDILDANFNESERINRAYRAARQARFEHGENGFR